MTWWDVITGDSLEVLATLPDNSFDAMITDPPYGFEFMGRDWDKALPDPALWREVRRVLKPGAYGAAFGAPRMYHRLACSLEDAKFQIRDCLSWLYGQGFPKNHNVLISLERTMRKMEIPEEVIAEVLRDWLGYGTALKPAWEPIALCRKKPEGTVAKNLLAHGAGALNIDAARIGERWPANLALDELAAQWLDEHTGKLKSSYFAEHRNVSDPNTNVYSAFGPAKPKTYNDEGGASRFFYCAKASRSEREAGLEGRIARQVNDGRATSIDNAYQRGDTKRLNVHPTVKPVALMRWLCRLICPEGGLILDPFVGSGSTGIAARLEGFDFAGIELDPEFADVARVRIDHALGEL